MKGVDNQEMSFDSGAWLVVASIILFAIVVIIPTLYVLRMPGDGWQMVYEEPPLSDFLGSWPTSLKAGDVVQAVDGMSVAPEILSPRHDPAAEWQAGSARIYSIQRNGQEQEVEVKLHVLTLGGVLKAISNTMRADLPQLSWSIIGLIVFLLRPRDTAARLFFVAGASLALVTRIGWAATTVSYNFAPRLIWYLQAITNIFWAWLFFPALILLMLVFPQPLWVPRRFPRLILALFFLMPLILSIATFATGQAILANMLLAGEAVIIFVVATTAVVHAYRNRRNPVLRAQVSWVAFGIAISIGGTLVAYLLQYQNLSFDSPIWSILSWPITLALPVCITIAILRYRLFDINVIIRKTLIYSVVTVLLALVYFGLVVFLQGLVDRISGQQSPIVIVISTLVIAALFAPLRNRVQKVVDRRFYRQKYDAQQILEQFAKILREETNIDELTADLEGVIQSTLEPEQVSIALLTTRHITS